MIALGAFVLFQFVPRASAPLTTSDGQTKAYFSSPLHREHTALQHAECEAQAASSSQPPHPLLFVQSNLHLFISPAGD
ncbi:hypothetical protein BDW69DRAFT_159817 [Aspergillus filifer]